MNAERTDCIGFGDLRLTQRPEDFCYGVDAVILADFAARGQKSIKTIMDLGTGNGIIPLILSHKTNAQKIYGVEVQENAFEIACRNVEQNGLKSKITMIHGDIRQIGTQISAELTGSLDMVVSNPPYMASQSGLTNVSHAKTIARHEIDKRFNSLYYI